MPGVPTNTPGFLFPMTRGSFFKSIGALIAAPSILAKAATSDEIAYGINSFSDRKPVSTRPATIKFDPVNYQGDLKWVMCRDWPPAPLK